MSNLTPAVEPPPPAPRQRAESIPAATILARAAPAAPMDARPSPALSRLRRTVRSRALLAAGGLALSTAAAIPGCGIPCQTTRTCPVESVGGDQNLAGASASGGKAGGSGTASGGQTASGGKPGNSTGGDASLGGAGGAGAPSDSDTPPRVVKVSPRSGSNGVQADEAVSITFSEPMDTGSVEAALSVSNVLPGDLELAWDGNGTQLTIAATGGWPYATGESPADVDAREYRVTLGEGASDLSGNHVLSSFETSFQTLRRLKMVFIPTVSASYYTYSQAVGDPPRLCEEDPFKLGDWFTIQTAGDVFAFVEFNTASLGQPTETAPIIVEEAVFRASQLPPDGAFYDGGTIVLDKLVYQAIDETVLDAPSEESLGVLCDNPATATPQMSVLSAFSSAFTAGEQRQLYRLSGPGAQANDLAYLDCSGFELRVTYLIP